MTLPPVLASPKPPPSFTNGHPVPTRPDPVGAVRSPLPALPAECLERILRASIQGLSPSSRYRILRSACLVCRDWRLPAAALLYRDVVIHSQSTATKWIASPASERFVAERIELDGRYGQVDAYAAESVLIKAKPGLKRLHIDFVRGLSSRAFVLPNLASEYALSAASCGEVEGIPCLCSSCSDYALRHHPLASFPPARPLTPHPAFQDPLRRGTAPHPLPALPSRHRWCVSMPDQMRRRR